MRSKSRLVLSILLALSVFGAFITIIGIDVLLANIVQVSLPIYLGAGLCVVFSYSLRGLVWHKLFSTGEVQSSLWQISKLYLAAQGIKAALPVGQLAIQPIIAYSISRRNYFTTERAFAIISVGDTVNLLPFYTIGISGIVYILFDRGEVTDLRMYLLSLVGLGILISLLAIVFWKYTGLFRLVLQKSLFPIRKITVLINIESVTDALSEESIDTRIDEFYYWIGELFEDKTDVIKLFTLSHLSILLLVAGLMLVGVSLSVGFAVSTACVLVSLSQFGTLLPSPGGVGGVEAILVGLGLLLTSHTVGELTTVVILYRLFTYWMILGVGLTLSSQINQEFTEAEETLN